jgi:hypothetical protein
MFMNRKLTENSGYQSPRVEEIVLSSEGILCASDNYGETNDLTVDDLGDIWY